MVNTLSKINIGIYPGYKLFNGMQKCPVQTVDLTTGSHTCIAFFSFTEYNKRTS